MREIIWVGAGGCIGAVLRYLLSGKVQDLSGSIDFPWGTLTVNLLGCLVIGALTYMAEARALFSPETRLFLMVGILGAFTTFSTFANESLSLIRSGQVMLALVYIGGHTVIGILFVLIGYAGSHTIWR
jgi:CrcB protein